MQLGDQARGAGRPWRGVWVGILGLIAIAVAGVIGSAPSPLHAQPHIMRAGHQAEAKNMRLLGYNDLQARSAYQPVIQQQGNRWIAYIGHHGGMALNPLTAKEESNGTSIVDVTVESRPFPVANYQVREADGAFCERGGRFGSHDASHENFTPIYYKRVMFFSWFNAGVRAVDIRDPYQPREIAYYIPAATEKTERRCLKTAAGSSTSSTAPTPACTSWSSPGRPVP